MNDKGESDLVKARDAHMYQTQKYDNPYIGNFHNVEWKSLELHSYVYRCWNCNREVSSQEGIVSWDQCTYMLKAAVYICPHCHAPVIIDNCKKHFPQEIVGKSIKNLPENIKYLYEESRKALSVGAYTACVMVLRKILMNLAVENGAGKNETFAKYVDYLCDKGIVHIKQRKRVESIRELGNVANHQIENRTEGEASILFEFMTHLLIDNYEFGDESEN